MLGTVGGVKRMDVTVISDVVNVASRLESLTKEKGESILVSGEIVSSLEKPGHFNLSRIGSTSIRGRVKPVDIWAARNPE
jgi:class 3 adenylate cyclase